MAAQSAAAHTAALQNPSPGASPRHTSEPRPINESPSAQPSHESEPSSSSSSSGGARAPASAAVPHRHSDAHRSLSTRDSAVHATVILSEAPAMSHKPGMQPHPAHSSVGPMPSTLASSPKVGFAGALGANTGAETEARTGPEAGVGADPEKLSAPRPRHEGVEAVDLEAFCDDMSVDVLPEADIPEVQEGEVILVEEDAGGATSVSSVITLCNTAIGAGVLSLPYAFRCAGWAGAALLCIVLGSCESFTMYVLSKFAERYRVASYGQLVRRALGIKLATTQSAVMALYLTGTCTAYLIIIMDGLQPFARAYLGADSIWAQRHTIGALVAVFVILPMCFPRKLTTLEKVSAMAVGGFVFVVCVILTRGLQIAADREPPFQGIRAFNLNIQALHAIPIVVFGFNCHANVVSIFSEMHPWPKVLIRALPDQPIEYHRASFWLAPRPRSRKMIGMISVILISIVVIMAGYLLVGFAGYAAYPDSVASNVLVSFPTDDPVVEVARLVMVFVVTCHYPLNHHPARLAIEELENYLLGWRPPPRAAAAQAIAFVSATYVISQLVRDLGTVLGLIGGTASCFIIFFLPGLLLMNSAIVKHTAASIGPESCAGDPGTDPSDSGDERSSPSGSTSCADLASVAADSDIAESMMSRAIGRNAYHEPLMLRAESKELGMKRVGLMYSPRRSWWVGLALVSLAAVILAITLLNIALGLGGGE